MNYSLGCAFTFDDLLINFPYKKLQFNCNDAEKITGDKHRDKVVKRIFLWHLRQVIEDIIHRNVTFDLPLTGKVKANMHMRRIRGEDFKRMRKCGKWKDLDIVTSMFSGYVIGFYMFGDRPSRVKSVYLNKELRDKIVENTNKGMAYGDGKDNTNIYDYLKEVLEQFPTISKSDIVRILKYCWKAVYLHNSYGGDTILHNKLIWCYIGNLKKDSLSHFYYYIRKLSIKLRVLYLKKKIEWDGYYYFALTDPQYLKYLDQKRKRGRPRKWFNYGNVCLYLIKDDCLLRKHDHKYIFRVPYISKMKLTQIAYDFTSDKAELIMIREHLKFKDILVYNNKYEVLC